MQTPTCLIVLSLMEVHPSALSGEAALMYELLPDVDLTIQIQAAPSLKALAEACLRRR
jgi:hypothetical protein